VCRVLEEVFSDVSAALEAGLSALDAVERSVRLLEECEHLNAGRGSALTRDGRVEMDATIADGRGRRSGAVAVVEGLSHPISAARTVMEASPHVLLVGPAALAFARARGLEVVDPASLVTEERRRQLARSRARRPAPPAASTVGAVARDRSGHLAAATSTGGTLGKLPGRVGDSAVLGAGTWADDATCAVSGTGDGEVFVRCAFAHEVDAGLRLARRSLAAACTAALGRVRRAGGSGGCIAVDRAGRVCLRFTTPGMARAWRDARGRVRSAIRPVR
jgi:isoaspartyl peptidase/L-asparaginase-like protein (Ntn-hydrolase superfamily)